MPVVLLTTTLLPPPVECCDDFFDEIVECELPEQFEVTLDAGDADEDEALLL